MAHAQQRDFIVAIKAAFPSFFAESRVLEVGSLDLNGSVRRHFSGGHYIGLDVGPGPGVDVVCQGQDYDAPNGSFDVVISCEVMEHNPFWRQTFNNMLRLCRPGGLLVMTCASTGRPEHGTRRTTPDDAPLIDWKDYYGNLEARDFKGSIALSDHLTTWMFYNDFSCWDLYFVGFKTGAAAPQCASAAFASIRRHYLMKNLRNPKGLCKRLLIKVGGEQIFMAYLNGVWPGSAWRRSDESQLARLVKQLSRP
jgi:SAM-dependent methyltransferase